jgi:hypothetical protein
MASEVVSIRLPAGVRQELRLAACRRSLNAGQEIRWTTLVKEAIRKLLTEEEKRC